MADDFNDYLSYEKIKGKKFGLQLHEAIDNDIVIDSNDITEIFFCKNITAKDP